MIRSLLTIIALVSLSGRLSALEIALVYPRVENPEETFVYEDKIDSTFLLGHVIPASGSLTINDNQIEIDEFGAFIAFLPLRKGTETKFWNLNLIQQGDTVSQRFDYQLRSDLPAEPQDSIEVELPAIVEIVVPNSHLRTMPEGSYYLFPTSGTRLRALESVGRFITVQLGAETLAIEKRFVEYTNALTLPEITVSNGDCVDKNGWSIIQFEITSKGIWRADLAADARELNVLLYDAKSDIDRIRYDAADDFPQDIVWRQDPNGLMLSLRFSRPITRGYRISTTGEILEIRVRQPWRDRDRRLKNKIIVLDAGHGGDADGSIGPLGNREKDVTLRWARILAHELERRGALVVLTREHDVTLGLYERIEIANGVGADFLLSLHGNALPDGVNPATRSGTGTYYYQSHSRRGAELLHRQLLKAGGLNDDGLYDANFAVARPTEFPAVLLEAAYMMLPEEERLMMNDEFLKKLSRGIVKGLQEYFKDK